MEKNTDTAPLTGEMMEQMLDEIAQYSIDIEEDPTQIHLGIPYLQKVLAKCRQYQNRVQFYMQKVKRYENRLRSEQKLLELDLEFKMQEKLADDALVRKQPSIEDRKALAATMLAAEHHRFAELQVQIQDVEETFKIIKSKHQELQRTSNDIKTQRNLVKDDMLARLGGGEGYGKPQSGADRSVAEGLPPPVRGRIDPKDLLDDNKRPDDMPKPIDGEHARLIADFMNASPILPQTPVVDPTESLVEAVNDASFISTEMDQMFDGVKYKKKPQGFDEKFVSGPAGTRCSICKEPQFTSPGGNYCKNGHGGADPLDENEVKEDPGPPVATGMSYEDLLS